MWLGWFGFNPGSTMALDPDAIAHIMVSTNSAGIMALLSATLVTVMITGKPDLGMSINGPLAGSVATHTRSGLYNINFVLPGRSIGRRVVVFAVLMFDKLRLDDPVGALGVHLANGIFGTLSIGLFAQEGVTGLSTANGLFFGGGFKLLGVQTLGVLATGVFVVAASSLIWLVIKNTIGLRVSLKEEIEGLDIGEHGMQAYPEQVLRKTPYRYISEDKDVDSVGCAYRQIKKASNE